MTSDLYAQSIEGIIIAQKIGKYWVWFERYDDEIRYLHVYVTREDVYALRNCVDSYA